MSCSAIRPWKSTSTRSMDPSPSPCARRAEPLAEGHERRQRLHGLGAHRGDVHGVGDHASGERRLDLLGGDDPRPVLRLGGRSAQMGRHDHVTALEEGMLGERLRREDVQGGAADLAGLQPVEQRVEVDQLAAGAVDDPHAVAHPRDRLGVDPSHRLRCLRQVDRDQVGPPVELLARVDPVDSELAKPLWGDELVEGDHLHVERLRALGDQLSDAPEADHAKRLAVELVAPVARARPLAIDQRRVRLRHVPAERESERQGVLGRGHGIRLRRVGDDDPAGRRRGHVDVVHARARTPDHLQLLGESDQLRGHLGRRADQDRVELADPPFELCLVPVEPELDVELRTQQVDAGVGDLLLDQDPRNGVGQRPIAAHNSRLNSGGAPLRPIGLRVTAAPRARSRRSSRCSP